MLNCRNARVKMNNVRNDVKQTVETYQEIVNALKNPLEEIKIIIDLLS